MSSRMLTGEIESSSVITPISIYGIANTPTRGVMPGESDPRMEFILRHWLLGLIKLHQ